MIHKRQRTFSSEAETKNVITASKKILAATSEEGENYFITPLSQIWKPTNIFIHPRNHNDEPESEHDAWNYDTPDTIPSLYGYRSLPYFPELSTPELSTPELSTPELLTPSSFSNNTNSSSRAMRAHTRPFRLRARPSQSPFSGMVTNDDKNILKRKASDTNLPFLPIL